MPVAHVSAVSAVMQAFDQQQMLQTVQHHVDVQEHQSALQNAAATGRLLSPPTQSPLGQPGLSQLNAFDAYQNAVPRAHPNGWYHRMQAEAACEKGDKIIDRIAFWSAVPFARWRLQTLADQLEAVSDEIERWAA